MLQDILFGLKLLWKQKAFSLAALLTLALCIGANTAVFTILHAVVLSGLPFPDSDRLVTMYNLYPGVGVTDRGANGVPDYLDRRKLTDVFEEVALIGSRGYDVGQEGATRRIDGEYVTPSYFRVLKTQPLLGRTFSEDEAVQGKDHVAILTESLWNEMFARDPNVIGRDIRLSGVPYRIVGVMPNAYQALDRDRKLWVPFAFTPEQTSDDARHSNNWGMIATLKRGATVAQARQRVDALNKANLTLFPKYKDLLESARFQTKVIGMKDEMVRDIKDTLYLLQAAVLGVLLIGCVNLANLILVRTSARIKELAVRFSLGAGRWRLSRQLLTESVAISVLGGLLGVGVALGGIRLLAWLGAEELPRGDHIRIDSGVLLFTMVTTLLTGLVFGSVPLLSLFKRDLNEVFRGNERMGTAGRHALSLRATLVVIQVSLAFTLLIGSGLLTRSFMRLMTVDPGFRAENVVTAQFSLPPNRYKDDAQRRNAVDSLLEKARAIPGVKQVGVTTYLPFSGNNNSSVLVIDGHELAPGELPPVPGWNTIDSGYLKAMGIPLLAGRNFSDSDGPDSQRVILVDQFMARRYWPNSSPIGSKMRQMDNMNSKDMFTIVGVVGSVKTGDLAEQNPVGQVYFHYRQNGRDNMHVVLRGETDKTPLTNALRGALAQVDPEVALFDAKSMPERMSTSLLNRRAAMALCLIFAGLALLLAAVGIYGVLAYGVAQRTREIGIRMALGANARDVLRMVLGQGAKVTGIGLVIGAAAAFLGARAMASLLFEVKPYDPLVFLATGALLAGVALVASFIPSLRAVWIHPSEALRHD
ncbi:MAG TPA: ABC transporter permease [Blastocatellia bacterium]|jgi:predicted permease|nr:ABC transporter permease [Blastocatellia bacterium]